MNNVMMETKMMTMDVIIASFIFKNNVLYMKKDNVESVMLKDGNLILIDALQYVEIN